MVKTDWFSAAKKLAQESNNPKQVACVVVRDGVVISKASNSHEGFECKRAGYATGVGYELCEGCQYINHAEYKAVQVDVDGGDLYLYGHYYACENCVTAILMTGIKNVYIKEE